MASNDPDFERKAADIIGLYLPPAACRSILRRRENGHPGHGPQGSSGAALVAGSGGAAWIEYYRHGTLSLYAAFNTKTGEVIGKTAKRHTSEQFVAFLMDLVVSQPQGGRST